MEGISASLPSDQIQSMENHDYIDFVDIDKEGKKTIQEV